MESDQFRGTITVLPVRDIAESCAWYARTLGLETIYQHEGIYEGEETNYAIMARDGVQVHLILDESQPDAEAWTQAGNGYLYLKVRDVDAMFDEVTSRGVEVQRGMATENWGARAFLLTDPTGNAVRIEQEG